MLIRQKQCQMVKGIINAFGHLELCLVINLTVGGIGLVHSHQYLPLGMLVLGLSLTSSSKYLLPAKKLISNTALLQLSFKKVNILVI